MASFTNILLNMITKVKYATADNCIIFLSLCVPFPSRDIQRGNCPATAGIAVHCPAEEQLPLAVVCFFGINYYDET